MKDKPVLTVIGAGSITFTPKLLRDMIHHGALGGSTVRLVDIDEQNLATMKALADKLNATLPSPWTITSATDRRAALPGSDYVLISVDVARVDTWRSDFDIPVANGIRQVTGEISGPGGLFHSLRQIPLHVDVARDCAELAPDAVLLVESNPLNRICLAMRRYSTCGEILGLCHGVEITQHHLGRLLALDCEEILATAAGTNHFTWILDLRRRDDGTDLYPALRQKLASADPSVMPLSRKLFNTYGFFPACGDEHIGEYLPYAWEFVGTKGPDFNARAKHVEETWRSYRELIQDDRPLDEYKGGKSKGVSFEEHLEFFFAPRSWVDTLAFPIMDSIYTNNLRRMPAVNMINDGAVTNLPPDVFVETPASVDSSGCRLISTGALPKPLAAFCRRDVDLCEMTVEAAMSGSRRLVLQAMLLDPVVDSVSAAEKTLDQMLKTNAPYLPHFA